MMEQLDRLALAMVDFERGNAKRIQHFTKVHTYGRWIAKWENVNPVLREIIDVVTLTHDIGIKVAMDRFGKSTWALQEELGPQAAEPMLTELGYGRALIEQVCYLIGHHHTYTHIDGLDYQILVEADFLVNFQEGNQPMSAMPHVYETIFRTEAGRDLLRRMYDFTPEA